MNAHRWRPYPRNQTRVMLNITYVRERWVSVFVCWKEGVSARKAVVECDDTMVMGKSVRHHNDVAQHGEYEDNREYSFEKLKGDLMRGRELYWHDCLPCCDPIRLRHVWWQADLMLRARSLPSQARMQCLDCTSVVAIYLQYLILKKSNCSNLHER